MESPIFKMTVISFLNAAVSCAAKDSTNTVNTQKLLTGGYINIPSNETVEAIFTFLKKKELISTSPPDDNKPIPGHFKVLNTALEWAQNKDW